MLGREDTTNLVVISDLMGDYHDWSSSCMVKHWHLTVFILKVDELSQTHLALGLDILDRLSISETIAHEVLSRNPPA